MRKCWKAGTHTLLLSWVVEQHQIQRAGKYVLWFILNVQIVNHNPHIRQAKTNKADDFKSKRSVSGLTFY